ncbi:MAG: RNA polymerase sigma factor [Wenzhouxiangellaceae bacterium]
MVKANTLPEVHAILERAVLRLCPDWQRSSRDDLVQTAVMRILERMPPGEENPDLNSSYLYKTAHSVLIDEIRRTRRRGETSIEYAASVEDSNAPDPMQITEQMNTSSAIRECLQEMVQSRSLGVTLYLQGHRIADIARLLDWRPKKADNAVYRGLADLRNCLREKGIAPK